MSEIIKSEPTINRRKTLLQLMGTAYMIMRPVNTYQIPGGFTTVTQINPTEYNYSIYNSGHQIIENFVSTQQHMSGFICPNQKTYNTKPEMCREQLTESYTILIIVLLLIGTGLTSINRWLKRKKNKIKDWNKVTKSKKIMYDLTETNWTSKVWIGIASTIIIQMIILMIFPEAGLTIKCKD